MAGFAQARLAGAWVVSFDEHILGRVHDIEVDPKRGLVTGLVVRLVEWHVKAGGTRPSGRPRAFDRLLLIPTEQVLTVTGRVVLSRPLRDYESLVREP